MHPALKWLWDYEFCIRKLEKPPCILAHIFSLFLPFIMLATSSLSQVCICLEASLKSVSFVATGLHAYTYELPFYSKKASLEKLCLFCRTIIWTRDSRMVFGARRLTFYYDDHHAAAFCLDLYMLTGSQPKLFLYNYWMNMLMHLFMRVSPITHLFLYKTYKKIWNRCHYIIIRLITMFIFSWFYSM